VRLFVPGRLEVFGKHTDYAGGHSLVAAVPQGITVTAECTDDGEVVVPGSLYADTVVRRLKANFPGAALSCRIAISSDLPQAAGMSSSSALVIAIAESIVACAGLEQTEAWQANIRTLEDRAAYFACIENGSRFGVLAGDSGAGTHGGSEDHAAIVMSRAGYLQLFSFRPLRSERSVKMPDGWTFVVAWSGVSAEKTGAAREAYNRLADPKAMTGARLQHFVAEDARAQEAAGAFARGDIGLIGALAADSQRDADRLLGNQVPETRELVRLALEAGAAAASSFGAGWGGSVWALVQTDAADGFAAEWLRAYQSRRPHVPSGAVIAPPAAGACVRARTD
jgi:galactokinase